MTEGPKPSFAAAFFGTVHGRIIGALAIISMVLGIAYEGIQVMTAYYNMRSVGGEMEAKIARDQAPRPVSRLDDTAAYDKDFTPKSAAKIREFCASRLNATINRLAGVDNEIPQACFDRLRLYDAKKFCTNLKRYGISKDQTFDECVASYEPE